MEKIRLGKTGMMVTRLGFGGIPIQRLTEDDAVKVIQRCLDLGVNFLDTANSYSNSEERIGKAIKGRRHNLYIATKTLPDTPKIVEKNLDLSLKRLNTDYIDLYQLHNVHDIATLNKILDPENGLYKVFEKAQKAGKIRHIGITSHQIDAAKAEIKTGRFETMMFPFNFITNEAAKELLPLCREQDMGFIAMKPLAGGMLNDANLCIKYLLRFPDIVVIPGIEMVPEIEEIAAIYEGPPKITAAERKKMQKMKAELGNRFCRRCDYCQPCPQEIPISMVMTFPTFVNRMPPGWQFSRGFVVEGMEKAAGCTECGECEEKCPYKLPIREMIKEACSLFEEAKAANAK